MPSWVTFDPDTRIMTVPEQLVITNLGLYTFSRDAFVANGDGNYFTEKMSAQEQVIAGETEEIDPTSNFIEITDADEMIHRVHSDYDVSEFEWQSEQVYAWNEAVVTESSVTGYVSKLNKLEMPLKQLKKEIIMDKYGKIKLEVC